MKDMKNQKGFSLIELLVVVIIIAIIAAIAIPNLLASRRAANEASAISSMRTVHSAQATWQATRGNNVSYSTTLVDLGPTTAAIIDGVLGGADPSTKSGYTFTLTTSGTNNEFYCLVGTPVSFGVTGTGLRDFAVGNDGVVYADTTSGAMTCTDGVVAPSGTGAAID